MFLPLLDRLSQPDCRIKDRQKKAIGEPIAFDNYLRKPNLLMIARYRVMSFFIK
jgi:hypothetical protein